MKSLIALVQFLGNLLEEFGQGLDVVVGVHSHVSVVGRSGDFAAVAFVTPSVDLTKTMILYQIFRGLTYMMGHLRCCPMVGISSVSC